MQAFWFSVAVTGIISVAAVTILRLSKKAQRVAFLLKG